MRVDLACAAVGEVHDHDPEPVGLETRPLHRPIGQAASVRRDHRTGVPGRIGGGQVAGRRRAVDLTAVDIEIGAPRLGPAGEADREEHCAAVRGDRVVGGIAERLGRGVAIDPLHQRHRRAGRDAFRVQGHGEQMRARSVGPCVPVAHKETIIHAAGRVVGLAMRQPQPRVGRRLRIREHGQRYHEMLAVPGRLEAPDIHRQIRDLNRCATGYREAPDLVRAATTRDRQHRRAVGAPGWLIHPGLGVGQTGWRPTRRERQNPHRMDRLVAAEIGRSQRKGDHPPIRRDRRIGQTIERHQILCGERPGLHTGCRGQGRQNRPAQQGGSQEG